jgi:short-subunit dehydrogenase involved in D-alanine esterification of teichoic acids
MLWNSVIAAHPDLDCVFLNAGMQRKCDFSVPEEVDMGAIEEEFTVSATKRPPDVLLFIWVSQ